MFADREEAGVSLAARVPGLDPETALVLALPRGGVPVAAAICAAQGLPLDLLLVRKIGAPGHSELALGAIVDGDAPLVVVNDDIAAAYGLSARQVEEMGRELLPEIARRRRRYLGGRGPLPLAGRTVVVVDDGVATGASLRAALKAVRRAGPARIILALPVAPRDVLALLRHEAEEVICLETPDPFWAVGAHYRNFPQVSDEEVILLVERHAPPEPAAGMAQPK